MTLSIDTTGIQNTIDLLYSIVKDTAIRRDLMFEAVSQTGVFVESLFDEYPSQTNAPLPKIHSWTSSAGNSIKDSPFVSERQQRGFFASVNDGTTEVPYSRTGALGNSITSAVEIINHIIYLFVGSNLDYAPLVIGDDDDQAMYHEGNWQQFPTDVIQQISEIIAVFERNLQRIISRLLS